MTKIQQIIGLAALLALFGVINQGHAQSVNRYEITLTVSNAAQTVTLEVREVLDDQSRIPVSAVGWRLFEAPEVTGIWELSATPVNGRLRVTRPTNDAQRRFWKFEPPAGITAKWSRTIVVRR